MSDIAIQISDLSKRYRIGMREKYPTIRETLMRAASKPLRQFRTWATGETFQLLSQNSLLFGESAAKSIQTNSEAFRRGLEHSGRSGGLVR